MTDKLTPEEQATVDKAVAHAKNMSPEEWAEVLGPEEIDRINRQKDKLTVLVAVVGPLVLVLILLGVSVWFGWWAT